MGAEFDRETIERFRAMPARRAFEEAKSAVYRSGPVSSDDFMDIFSQLVDEGILTWDQVEDFSRS
jgi:hypothetical protein